MTEVIYEFNDYQSAVFIVLLPLLIATFAGAVCLHGCARRYADIHEAKIIDLRLLHYHVPWRCAKSNVLS